MYTFKILCIAAKIQVNEQMLLTQEPTMRKAAATHAFQIMEWFIVTYHPYVKPQLQSHFFKRESMHSCMRTHNKLRWGQCLVAKIPHFIHLSYIICHLIPILSFHKTINFHHFHNTYGFILPFPNYLFWVFLREFLIKY